MSSSISAAWATMSSGLQRPAVSETKRRVVSSDSQDESVATIRMRTPVVASWSEA